MQRVRVGIIGAGGIATGHASAYLKRSDVQLMAVADVDEDRAKQAAQTWGCEATSVDGLIERSDIDAVSVCTPPNSHAKLSMQALRAGKHVLVEKPIALDLDEADAMIDAAKQAGRLLMVGHTHRYWPANVRAKELLEEGAIGEIIMVSDDILSDNRVSNGIVPWRLRRHIAGGGVVMDNGVHSLDRLAWWVNSPVETVFGRVSTDLDPIDVENNALTTLTFANGAYAQARLSFTAPKAAGRCRAEFIGTKGMLSVETWGDLLLTRHGKGPESIAFDRSKTGLEMEIADFIESITQGTQPKTTGQVGRAALELVLAVYKSSEQRMAVRMA